MPQEQQSTNVVIVEVVEGSIAACCIDRHRAYCLKYHCVWDSMTEVRMGAEVSLISGECASFIITVVMQSSLRRSIVAKPRPKSLCPSLDQPHKSITFSSRGRSPSSSNSAPITWMEHARSTGTSPAGWVAERQVRRAFLGSGLGATLPRSLLRYYHSNSSIKFKV